MSKKKRFYLEKFMNSRTVIALQQEPGEPSCGIGFVNRKHLSQHQLRRIDNNQRVFIASPPKKHGEHH